MTAKGLTIEQKYYFESPSADVYKALTDPELLIKWFLERAAIAPETGGSYSFTWVGGYKKSGKVEKIVPNRSVAFSWPDELGGGKVVTTHATFTISKKGNGTILSLRQTGFETDEAWSELYGSIQSRWAYYLMNLKSVLDHGIDLRSAFDE